MKSLLAVACAGAIVLGLSACKPKNSSSANAMTWEPDLTDSQSVFFDITSADGPNGSLLLLGTYSSEGKVARFKIELERGQGSGPTPSDPLRFVTGNGAFIAEPGSDDSVLLAKLRTALEAKKVPSKVKRTGSLAFTYIFLGRNQSRISGGGFTSNPPGDWTAMKISMPTKDPGEDDCEVFLNFSINAGKAEFSEKDVLFGDEALKNFASVL